MPRMKWIRCIWVRLVKPAAASGKNMVSPGRSECQTMDVGPIPVVAKRNPVERPIDVPDTAGFAGDQNATSPKRKHVVDATSMPSIVLGIH